MAAEHGGALGGGHGDLGGAEGHEAAGEVVVVAEQQAHREHQVVDVVEDQRLLPPVRPLVLHEVHRVLPPVPPRVQVVRHVIPVVVAVSVALLFFSRVSNVGSPAHFRKRGWVVVGSEDLQARRSA